MLTLYVQSFRFQTFCWPTSILCVIKGFSHYICQIMKLMNCNCSRKALPNLYYLGNFRTALMAQSAPRHKKYNIYLSFYSTWDIQFCIDCESRNSSHCKAESPDHFQAEVHDVYGFQKDANKILNSNSETFSKRQIQFLTFISDQSFPLSIST